MPVAPSTSVWMSSRSAAHRAASDDVSTSAIPERTLAVRPLLYSSCVCRSNSNPTRTGRRSPGCESDSTPPLERRPPRAYRTAMIAPAPLDRRAITGPKSYAWNTLHVHPDPTPGFTCHSWTRPALLPTIHGEGLSMNTSVSFEGRERRSMPARASRYLLHFWLRRRPGSLLTSSGAFSTRRLQRHSCPARLAPRTSR